MMERDPIGTSLGDAWRSAWAVPVFRRWTFVVLAAAVPIVWGLPAFFQAVEARPGALPYDPVLPRFVPKDVTWATFAVLYGTLVAGLFRLSRKPWSLLRTLVAYLCLTGMRMVTLWSFTLEPPPTIIPLTDPFTQFFYPGATPFLKDLFFSGHTATLALLACTAERGPWRWWTILATVAIGALVMVQHVHWTVDVLTAPVFAFVAWYLSGRAPGLRGNDGSAFAAA